MRFVFEVQYDGTDFFGWQVQPGTRTVQGELHSVLSEYGFTGLPVAAGRTDTGVHARAMAVHAECPGEFKIPLEKAADVISKRLPKDIAVLKVFPAPTEDFHARFSACGRSYTYSIHTKRDIFKSRYSTYFPRPKIDFELLVSAAKVILGKHDFTTFSKHNPDTKSSICEIKKAEWTEPNPGEFQFYVKADRFIYGMVRSLVGSMLDVATGKRSLDDFNEALTTKDRNRNSRLAPAAGLTFEKSYYPHF
jgi:tRNA pseudouridine38-40 synthase